MSACGKAALGQAGEERACRFLEAQGQRILERNWRAGHLEIDIITLSDSGLHIVEVKTRLGSTDLQPESRVDAAKQRKLVSAARRYLRSHPEVGDREIFFDIIAIVLDGGHEELRYFPAAWIPLYL